VYKTQEGYEMFLDDAFTLLLVLKLAKPWLKVGPRLNKLGSWEELPCLIAVMSSS
jgi:hypothetical protein